MSATQWAVGTRASHPKIVEVVVIFADIEVALVIVAIEKVVMTAHSRCSLSSSAIVGNEVERINSCLRIFILSGLGFSVSSCRTCI